MCHGAPLTWPDPLGAPGPSQYADCARCPDHVNRTLVAVGVNVTRMSAFVFPVRSAASVIATPLLPMCVGSVMELIVPLYRRSFRSPATTKPPPGPDAANPIAPGLTESGPAGLVRGDGKLFSGKSFASGVTA